MSPQPSNNYPCSECIPLSPIRGLPFEPCKAIRRRKIYSVRKNSHILCKVDGFLIKNPDLSLHCVAKELKVPVLLTSKLRKQYDSFLLLSNWKKAIHSGHQSLLAPIKDQLLQNILGWESRRYQLTTKPLDSRLLNSSLLFVPKERQLKFLLCGVSFWGMDVYVALPLTLCSVIQRRQLVKQPTS